MIRVLIALLWLALPASAHFGDGPDGPPLPTGFAPERTTIAHAGRGLAQVTLEYRAGEVRMRARLTPGPEIAAPRLPPGCHAAEGARVTVAAEATRLALDFTCRDASGALLLPWAIDGARLRVIDGDATADRYLVAGPLGLAVPVSRFLPVRLNRAETGLHYLHSGITHVLGGADHLAFVFCLILMASPRQLAWLVTCFTLGHSITLILAALGHLRLPLVPVEACIALSIVFLAREAWLARPVGPRDHAVTAGFGLIHGLGFASALDTLGLPVQHTVLALAAFNAGVEIGQLLFIAAVLLVGVALVRVPELPLRGMRTGILLVIGTVAAALVAGRVGAIVV